MRDEMRMALIKKLSIRHLAVLLIGLMMIACAENPAIDESRRLSALGQSEAALDTLARAMHDQPDNEQIRSAYFRTRELLVTQALTTSDQARAAGKPDDAETQARLALRLDPSNVRANDMLKSLDASKQRAARLAQADALIAKNDTAGAESIARALLAENPNDSGARATLRKLDELATKKSQADVDAIKGPFSKPITLEFRDTPLRNVFEAISRTAGINFVFDKDVKPDAKVTVFVRNTTIDEVIRLVLTTNQLERKMLNENSVLIYPANAAKERDYQELVTRTFYLTNTEAKQAQALVKQMVKTKDVFIDEKLNLMIIKDTPDAVRMAERLVATLDVPQPEVMLEVEVLEISRSKLLDLGLRFPDQIGYGQLNSPTTTAVQTDGSSTTSSGNATVAAGVISLRHTGTLVPFVSNPAITLNLQDQDGDSNILANPRIRVTNREKAKILIGDKLPVFTTTSTANVGVSASVNYLDVGLKLDVQPTIHLNDEVEMNVALEVSSIVKEVPGPQNSLAYQIGTRNASTVLRLKDGETQVLAGLISDEERSSANHLPGIGNLPVLGRLFTDKSSNASKTEIVLLITPHIVRNILPPQLSQAAAPAGTESSIGATPLSIGPTAPGALNIKGASDGVSNAPVSPYARIPGMPQGIPGMSPGVPTAAEQSPTANLQLSAPPLVSAAQDFIVTVAVRGNRQVQSGEVSIDFDSNLFELAPGVDSSTVPLQPGGTSANAQLHLRSKVGANGEGTISVSSSRVTTDSGDASVDLPSPVTIRVGALQ
ncbi:MAG TPA: secretin N-terminal domain-containing protein [Rhodocyclaceae bacterium]|nr:secretin N-terminal domain-containing protein [Rhodocyclaceae bacterium]